MKNAERLRCSLVNSKIDDLIDTAEFNWMETEKPLEVSDYMQELTQYLANTMSSVLLGLPEPIKDQIYAEALKHINKGILSMPLDPSVTRITAESAEAYTMDVRHLVAFVQNLPEGNKPDLLATLTELQQTTDLLTIASLGKGEEFFDSSKSRNRFGKVDKIKGAELLEKVQMKRNLDPPPRSARSPTFGSGEGFPGFAGHSKQGSVGGASLADRLQQRFAQRDRS